MAPLSLSQKSGGGRLGAAVTRLGLALLVVGLLSCRKEAVQPTRPSDGTPVLRYKVTYVREPERGLDVEVERLRDAPRDFLFTQPEGVDTVWAYSDSGKARALSMQDQGVNVPADTRFLRYHYPLEQSGRRRWWHFGGMGQGDDWLIMGRSWLLRPRVATPPLPVEFSVMGVDALLPWEPGPGGVYRITTEDLVDSGVQGLGGRRCQARLPDAVMDVAIVGKMANVDDAQICEWLRHTGEQVLKIRRHFPHPRVTVVVYPVPNRDDANVFGMVQWSTPPSIALMVGQDTTLAALNEDWAALHEMLHLTHPTILPRTPWISEGLATYLTEIARSRSGRRTAQRSWQELVEGFERGREQADGRTTQDMIDESSPPGIYWVGAYLALRIDVELRRVTGNQRGLEDVLELLATQGSTATVESYGAAVDAVAGRPIFKALMDGELPRPAFAGLEGLLEDLGVTSTPGGVKLQPARDSLLREALDGQKTASSQ